MKSPDAIGAVAGWLTVLGILGFEVIAPGIVAGERVSSTYDAQANLGLAAWFVIASTALARSGSANMTPVPASSR